jgi:inner membrane protein
LDSLTQIILGSAVAEASLGKKVGNRAMVWGAIAGTIPDLDVISNGFMSPIDSLAFHRGLTHSFLFEIIMAIILGWTVYKIYQWQNHKWLGIIGWNILFVGIGVIIFTSTKWSITGIVSGITAITGLSYLAYKRYNRSNYSTPNASIWDWQKMFFWSLFTHPILDCFTTYGTQFLLPFSNQRVAFNNIAVADPGYTLPFLICLIIAIFLPKGSKSRHNWNTAGLIISSLYMTFTLFNKSYVNTIFAESLRRENISYIRYMTTPSILNNILWSGIAETDNAYYYGQYSFFDAEKKFDLTKKMKTDPELMKTFEKDPTFETLTWFSDGYYALERNSSDSLSYYDLRFGTFRINPSDPDTHVFKFDIIDKGKYLEMPAQPQGPPPDAKFSDMWNSLWTRVGGKK